MFFCIFAAQNKMNSIFMAKKSKKEEQLKYISIVDQILAAKKGNMFEDTSALESEIDLLVYHLYGLTYDDVLIVDPETPITKEEYNNNKK